MALIVEDGSALTTSESYISVADADAYFAARNITLWASVDFSDTEKEACMRRATDYMTQVYRQRWAGYRATDTQALDWPRFYVPKQDSISAGYTFYESNEVPLEVVRACAELAFKAAQGELLSDQGTPVIEKTIGPITIKYAEGARLTKRYTAIDALLSPLLKDGGSSSMARVVRS